MKKLNTIIFTSIVFFTIYCLKTADLFAQESPSSSDSSRSSYSEEFDDLFEYLDSLEGAKQVEEGESFKTITIGGQTWMAENLNVTTFRNGDVITEVQDNIEWRLSMFDPAWCYYNNDANNGNTYGRLYNAVAINDYRGLAPAGWHIPTEAEWKILLNNLGSDSYKKMKSTSGWKDGNNGTNESNFNALPGGCRDKNGEFQLLTDYAYWWSASQSGDGNIAFLIRYYMSIVDEDTFGNYGLSVRCIKD